jgi:hypothetical protein
VPQIAPTVDHVERADRKCVLPLLEDDRPVERPWRIRRIGLHDARHTIMAGAQRRDPLRFGQHRAQFAASRAPLDSPH